MAFDFTGMTEEQVMGMMYPKQLEAYKECRFGKGNILVTGSGGMGKSFIIDALSYFARHETVTTGTTGVAAVSVNGATTHSTLGLPLGIPTKEAMKKVSKRFRSLFKRNHPVKNIIIDESSFLSPATLDSILQRRDRVSKTSKNKHVRILMFADFCQLLAVVKSGSQEASLMKELYGTTHLLKSSLFNNMNLSIFNLDKNKRSRDPIMTSHLENIRLGKCLNEALEYFNKRVGKPDPDAIFLTTKNSIVAKMNKEVYDRNPNEEYVYKAIITDKFNPRDTLLEETLKLKKGLRVMSLVNEQTEGDSQPRFINGSQGVIEDLMMDSVKVKFDNGETVWLDYIKQDNNEYYTNHEDELCVRSIGSFEQLAIKQSSVLTINKAQGLGFDKATIDFSDGSFASGQAYTALSRMTNIEGLTLTTPLTLADIKVDKEVKKFYRRVTGDDSMEDFKVIIAGGRTFNDYPTLRAYMDNILKNKNPNQIVIVSGTATGADKLGERYAKERGFRCDKFPAQWDKLGKRAGYVRNADMADYADALVAFYNGISLGTGHMINIAKEKELPTRIVKY